MAIVLTGGAGFIGSCFLKKLNDEGINDIVVVDRLGTGEKWKNLVGKHFDDYLEADMFIDNLERGKLDDKIDGIVHLGACSATTETDATYLIENNYSYSKFLIKWAMRSNVRFMYASSAATYGAGEQGYSDADEKTNSLRPLNMYGFSKHAFDEYVLKKGMQNSCVGMKYFNVFGPNEYHKGSMRSMVYHGYHQVKKDGRIRLFKSYKPEYADGEQKRDFVYVKDIVDIMWWFLQNPEKNGIFNLGTGQAHSWNELANAIFDALGVQPNIEYIEMPDELQGKYQYFTQADVSKLKDIGCPVEFRSLKDSVKDYVDTMEGSVYY